MVQVSFSREEPKGQTREKLRFHAGESPLHTTLTKEIISTLVQVYWYQYQYYL